MNLFLQNKAQILSETFLKFIQGPAFAPKDLLDILIVAILVFLILTLIKKTRAMPMFIGIILLGGVYVLSLVLKLQLTQTIFSGLIASLLIIFAIVFQRELRRFFEFIGLMGLRRKIFPLQETAIQTIMRAVHNLSERRIGALIVFPGRENIYRHLEGGVQLNGKISLPLILSIFDPSSPGHDGAVIAENETLRKFAVHLPMAENIQAVRKFGTRHRAALGLAERTDAFCIVVSEEKGTISVAHNKHLKTLENEGELELELKKFFSETFPQSQRPSYMKWIKDNLKYSIVSILIACAFWMLFTYQNSFIQRKYIVPIEFKNLDKQYVVDDYSPEEINVTFSGLETDFKLVNVDNLKVVFNLSGVANGWHRIEIKKEQINFPSDISLVKIDPESIKIHISQIGGQ
jgi:uncharacterized protein (TIGR00159 family)